MASSLIARSMVGLGLSQRFMLDGLRTLLPAEELKKRFEDEGISLDKPVMTSCGTGITACILALGLHRLGRHDAVYDGSWTQWGANPDSPVNQSS